MYLVNKYQYNSTMSQDLTSKFYSCINLRLEERLSELTKLLELSNPNKELQSLFPQLISQIFSSSFNNGWNLKTVTYDSNRYEYESLISFLGPQGPIFRLCYKLLSDPQLKYELPLNILPLDLQISLERGRCPQFYADMLVMDPQAMSVYALQLNPFDYYIFNFALHLVNSGQHQNAWENWNSVYFALSCDYLMHFLPSDPNVAVLPQIPNYMGKVPMAAPLQSVKRPLCTSSLLLIPDLCGMNNQPASPQAQSRNEVWRSESVLQVFIDIWMSVEQFSPKDVQPYQRSCPAISSSPERVRTVRVLVKHIHAFSAKQLADPATRSAGLRKYARQVMCARAYHYVKHLVMSWPLDASFRLVMELWLSLIQPWRYTNNTINEDRFPGQHRNRDEGSTGIIMDGLSLYTSFTQFVAENFPSYTCILQLVLPRFLRLDLTAYKNAVMLFRLGKVFSQPHLVPILWNLEQAMTDTNLMHQSHDTSYSSSAHEHSYTYNGVPLHKWVAVAKQAIAELNMSPNFECDPVWGETRTYFATEFVRRIHMARRAAENNVQDMNKQINDNSKGMWSSIKTWLMVGVSYEDETLLEDCKKVPLLLSSAVQQFTVIFRLSDTLMNSTEPLVEESILGELSSTFGNSSNLPQTVTSKLRSKHTDVHYMGDPDLMPITTYENTILVRMMYQISSKLNELYGEKFSALWTSNTFPGFLARELLEKPRTIRTYIKEISHQSLVTQELPARVSLRRLGSHAVMIWFTLGYLLFKLFSYSGYFYIFFLLSMLFLRVLTKATSKYFGIMIM